MSIFDQTLNNKNIFRVSEFIDLWKKNHYPLLKKAMENGDIISITASEPN